MKIEQLKVIINEKLEKEKEKIAPKEILRNYERIFFYLAHSKQGNIYYISIGVKENFSNINIPLPELLISHYEWELSHSGQFLFS